MPGTEGREQIPPTDSAKAPEAPVTPQAPETVATPKAEAEKTQVTADSQKERLNVDPFYTEFQQRLDALDLEFIGAARDHLLSLYQSTSIKDKAWDRLVSETFRREYLKSVLGADLLQKAQRTHNESGYIDDELTESAVSTLVPLSMEEWALREKYVAVEGNEVRETSKGKGFFAQWDEKLGNAVEGAAATVTGAAETARSTVESVVRGETPQESGQKPPETPTPTPAPTPAAPTPAPTSASPEAPKDTWAKVQENLGLGFLATGVIWVLNWFQEKGWFGDWVGGLAASVATALSDVLTEDQKASLSKLGIDPVQKVENGKTEVEFRYVSRDQILTQLRIDGESDRKSVMKLSVANLAAMFPLDGKEPQNLPGDLPRLRTTYKAPLQNLRDIIKPETLTSIDPNTTTVETALGNPDVRTRFYAWTDRQPDSAVAQNKPQSTSSGGATDQPPATG